MLFTLAAIFVVLFILVQFPGPSIINFIKKPLKFHDIETTSTIVFNEYPKKLTAYKNYEKVINF